MNKVYIIIEKYFWGTQYSESIRGVFSTEEKAKQEISLIMKNLNKIDRQMETSFRIIEFEVR